MLGRLAVAMGSHACVSHAATSTVVVHGGSQLEELGRALGIEPVLLLPRVHCTRTGRPTALESSAASAAASSAPLGP